MRHVLVLSSVLLASLALGGCEGREITVFDLPAKVGAAGEMSQAGTEQQSGMAGMLNEAGTGGANAGAGGVAGGMATLAGAPAGGVGMGAGMAGGGMGGMPYGAGGAPMACASNAECSDGWLCEKPDCEAPMGFCAPRPLFPDAKPMPVCGCDGITYWNDDYRRLGGAGFASPGQCRINACACEVGDDCMVAGASCSHVSPDEACGHSKGVCWVLPPTCPLGGDPQMRQECRPPDQPPGKCADTCTAIRSEKPYALPRKGTTCN